MLTMLTKELLVIRAVVRALKRLLCFGTTLNIFIRISVNLVLIVVADKYELTS